MKTRSGDLITLAIDGEFDVIVHGCNCFCTMGAGIARIIANEFPEAYIADRETPKGAKTKLGTFSHASTLRGGHQITIINGYTQYHFAGKSILIDYDAIEALFAAVGKEFTGSRIGYPKIGAGLGGGDWNRIAAIIDKQLRGEDHTLVILNTKNKNFTHFRHHENQITTTVPGSTFSPGTSCLQRSTTK